MSEESTTPDLVEFARRRFEAIRSRDLDELMASYAPDAVLDVTRTVGITASGHGAIRSFIADWWVGYEVLEYSAEEISDLGGGVAFGVICQKGRPVGTAGYVANREGFVCLVKEGCVQRETVYGADELDEARAAADRLAEERADD
jgi:ketosteroid isomerase-like protein